MAEIKSSQEFIRALKGASDPPVSGGPTKIEIARQAWDTNAFYLPSKAEVIVDWLLTAFLKDKSQSISTSPIFNTTYWQLLLDVLSASTTTHTRPLKTWLTPLLHRTPLYPILSTFLTKINQVQESQDALATLVSSCITKMWLISSQKISLENLADLVGLVLQYGHDESEERELNEGVMSIGILVMSSYRTSLGNSMNKKKFFLLFLQSYLPTILSVLSLPPPPQTNSNSKSNETYTRFTSNIYDTFTDTLFNLDILRQLSENRQTDQSTALFDRLSKARSTSAQSEKALLIVLPKLFLSYVLAVKKYRGAVFITGAQGSSEGGVAGLKNEEVHAASMRFFVSCEKVACAGAERGAEGDVEVWNARLRLLETVFDEKLFSIQQDDAAEVLGRIVEDAIGVLSYSWQDDSKDVISPAVRCLHKIGQIDCDLLLPSIPRILPALLPIPSTDLAPALFLDLILDYHSKTRTLNNHIHNLLTSFSRSSFPNSDTTEMHRVYEQCFSGHVLSTRHLDKLGNAIRRFLTPGQTAKTVEEVLETLKSSWERFFEVAEGRGDDEASPKKKKRKDTSTEDAMVVDSSLEVRSTAAESLAVSFSFQAYLVLLVLSNLPMQNLTETSTLSVHDSISKFRDQIIRKALEKLLRLKRLAPGSGKKKRRRESIVGDGKDGWAMQIAATAVLRVHYALCVAKGLGIDGDEEEGTEKIAQLAKEVVAREEAKGSLIPELEVEIFRTLLYHISTHDTRAEETLQVFDSILSYLERAFKPSNISWSGLPCQLTSPELGALSLLHLLLERWLPYLDHLASPAQLTSLIKIILSINIDGIPVVQDSNIRPEYALLRLLHSAEFWEMQNLRTAFLSHLVQSTTASNPQAQEGELASYRLLLYIPAEYFTRTARTHFVRRAYVADMELVRSFNEKGKKRQSAESQAVVLRNLITLRVFLRRMIQLVGFERVPDVDLGDFVVHLMFFDCQVEGSVHDVFIQSTLDLTVLCFSELLKNATQHSDALLKVITSFNQYSMFVEKSEESTHRLQSQIIAGLVNEVVRLKSPTSLPSDCIEPLRSFHNQLSNSVSRRIQGVTPSQLTSRTEALVGWTCVLELQRWLNENSPEDTEGFGRGLVSVAARLPSNNDNSDTIRLSVFAILRAELSLLTDPVLRRQHLEIVVATFVIFDVASGDTTRKDLVTHVSVISRSLSPDEYSHVLTVLSESLSSGSLPHREQEIMIHLANLLLRGHPQHTLKHMQVFATQCLSSLSGNKVLTEGCISLRLMALEFVLQHCSERPATLRSSDIGSICLILFRFLQPSENHDGTTTAEIFHKIVASISALVRLRRDLVTPVLPHLGQILRRLLSTIRSCRPQLGSKQTAMVMQTQPRWLSAKQPLGPEEGRMLSRLLETLNVKTIIRSHTASETQKAESLAKPFSKHAAYVLAAYIEALNDPLCILTAEMRRELEPGLFTLCEVMGEHSRDALVVGLDTSGKATLKLIWKEYEKQRYVGKG